MKTKGSVRALLLFVGYAGLALALFFARQSIVDHITVWQFEPSAEIKRLAERTAMSDRGEFMYYTGQPKISDRDEFNRICESLEDNNAILGCYAGGRIYIYNVTDQRLDGIKSVTAAHEMLHAAYERLSTAERKQTNELLEKEYQKLRNDSKFTERMSVYAKVDPAERVNELHSVLGTEIGTLSPELETYYERYFDDRSKVVALHSAYQGVFDSLQERADDLTKQLKDLQADIRTRSAAYGQAVKQLNRDIADFNKRANNGDFESEVAFQTERASLVSRASNVANERTAINNLIDQFNGLNAQLADIANQTKALNQSIDSSLPAAPRV